jgi:hypothetical protein
LTPELERRVERLREWQRLLDSAFRVPGTSIRFGWDPIIGLMPWAGDVLTALMSFALIAQAYQMRIPRVVQLRMVLNIGIDVVIGIVPFVGDIADVFWKSNAQNLALIERHARQPGPASSGDRAFVLLVVGAAIVIGAIPFIVLYWILSALGRGLW